MGRKKKEGLDSRFDIFWNLYPTRNGKRLGRVETRKKFSDLSEANQIACCRAAGVYAESFHLPLKPGEFRPEPRDPVRFLRNDWWKDWLTAPAAPLAKPCQFRQLIPCEKLALPGEEVCQEHKEFRIKHAERRQRGLFA